VAATAAQQETNFEQMSIEHQRLLARIRNHEDEKQVEPLEQLVVTPTLSSFIESTGEYIEDPP